MTDIVITPLLLAAIPIIGAILGLIVWSQPDKLRTWSVIVTGLSLLAVIGMSGNITKTTEGQLFLYLLPLAACISLLGGPVHLQHRLSWVLTLLFLGLGLGILTSQQVVGQIALVILLGLITFLFYWHHNPFWPRSWWGIGAYGLGALCAGLAAIASPPVSALASLLACAILLPLVPFHQGYVSVCRRSSCCYSPL
jgi:NADH-quinone oxidoreductase subunit M